jgi:TolA-binding protein
MAEPHAQLELAQRYATGALGAADAAAFEEHLLTCEQCQAEVRLVAGVRRLARDVQHPAVGSRANSTRFVAAAALLAAVIALVMLWPRDSGQLATLGQVLEPPAYVGVSVRNARQVGDSLFDAAMTAYVARRYADAESGLRAALAAGTDTIPTTFFMASAGLMAGHAGEAADAFARVIAAGVPATAYLPEAHLFRARALLQLGRGDDALAELDAVSRDSDRRAAAAALADSVTRVLRR